MLQKLCLVEALPLQPQQRLMNPHQRFRHLAAAI
jgi:hypothetical protein